jgi:AcrR family transcriptional regulator
MTPSGAAAARSLSATTPRPRTPRRAGTGTANPTRRRILEAALTLFNEHGTARVTTNHVATAAGLSPGNLYYWFRDKQDLVRALVAQWLAEFERHWDEVHDLPADVHAFWDDLGRTAELNRRYRFVTRELQALLYDDPELARSVRETYRRRMAAQLAYARRLVVAGVLQPPAPPRTLEDLVTALWLVAEAWPAHLVLTRDEKEPGRPPSGIRPLLAVLAPHLTEHGLRALEAL